MREMGSELIFRGGGAHESQPQSDGQYSPKALKRFSFLQNPILFHRFLFVLLGMAIASVFFFAFGSRDLTVGPHHLLLPADLAVRSAASVVVPTWYGEQRRRSISVGGKIPLGLKRKGMRVVVTGGAGFVGSHLVDRLMERGDSVIVVDNFFTGRKENVMHHFGNPNFELIRHDVVEPLLLEVDQIYHLACPASPVHYKFNPVKTIISFQKSNLFLAIRSLSLFFADFYCFLWFALFFFLSLCSFWLLCNEVFDEMILLFSSFSLIFDFAYKTNVVGTLNMLGLAKRVGARFLLTSTSEVYGDPLQHPQVETYWGNVNPIGVRSCYDEGKRTAETLAMDYHRGAQVEVRIARIFNTYGPRMCIDDGRVVSNFVAQALRKEPMTVYGDGKQTRSFQFVSDLVEGLMRLMEGEHVGPFNLGNPGEFTMLELAKVVQDTIDTNARIEFRKNTEDDPHKRKPDISRAKDLLGWEPKISLRNGLPLMVSDFRKRIFGDHNPTTDSASAA